MSRGGEVALADGVVERYTWDGVTYAATRHIGEQLTGRIQLTVGEGVRLHVEAGGWVLRGGTVGPEVLWRRTGAAGDQAPEQQAVADGFTGQSPAYALGLLTLLAVGEVRRLRLVAVTEPVLATRLVDEQWTRTPTGVIVDDLSTGERRLRNLP